MYRNCNQCRTPPVAATKRRWLPGAIRLERLDGAAWTVCGIRLAVGRVLSPTGHRRRFALLPYYLTSLPAFRRARLRRRRAQAYLFHSGNASVSCRGAPGSWFPVPPEDDGGPLTGRAPARVAPWSCGTAPGCPASPLPGGAPPGFRRPRRHSVTARPPPSRRRPRAPLRFAAPSPPFGPSCACCRPAFRRARRPLRAGRWLWPGAGSSPSGRGSAQRGGDQRPVKDGRRFSSMAFTASLWSSVLWARAW